MYIVRKKSDSTVVFSTPRAVEQGLSPQDIYPEFDESILELGWSEELLLPKYFTLKEDGQIQPTSITELVLQGKATLREDLKVENDEIVPKSDLELINDGLLELQSHEKLVDGFIVEKSMQEMFDDGLIELMTPFEYIEDNQIKERSLEEVVEQKLLKTKDQCELAIQYMNKLIEQQIAETYSPGLEMKITKAYMQWMNDGMPANDGRKQQFDEMSAFIEGVKGEFSEMKGKVKEWLGNFSL